MDKRAEKDMFVESLQELVSSMHGQDIKSVTYHLKNILRVSRVTLEQEHLFSRNHTFWVSCRPRFWFIPGRVEVFVEDTKPKLA